MRRLTLNLRRRGHLARLVLSLVAGLASSGLNAALDLRNATVQQLDNGLTVILLQDRNFPVVSVQMLYRVGARSEVTGKTGLAHFLEHMAFRDSENFPDAGLVAAIYARGGEWHGYTWTDQTTYFATAPSKHLDLLLRIEADRMARLAISADDMEAERGAVLAEMHMYENSPASMLLDAVLFTSFVAHPYRTNTIGWESDVKSLRHEDIVEFYERHYHPANAVLAVVGDIDEKSILASVSRLFGELPQKQPTATPHTLEPLQTGERRTTLRGDTGDRQFMIAYRAPSVSSADFAGFLVLQSMLGGSSGVNFLQNDWGTSVTRGARLYGAAAAVTTWFPPSEQDYVFVIGGSAAEGVAEAGIEREIEKRIGRLRQRAPNDRELTAAIGNVLEQLVYDVETTEDAAHQLAFFGGLHALDTLFALPDRVSAITAKNVQEVAARYLLPERRSIAWYLPSGSGSSTLGSVTAPVQAPPVTGAPAPPVDTAPVPAPAVERLSRGLPVIVQQSDLSETAYLKVVLPGVGYGGAKAVANDPVQEFTSLSYRTRPSAIARTIAHARAELADSTGKRKHALTPSSDPATRLEQVFGEFMHARATPQAAAPVLLLVSGSLRVDETLALLEKSFGMLAVPARPVAQRRAFAASDITVSIGTPVAQAQLGYLVPAAAPNDAAADAQRLLLYVLSHGYAGRLGRAAISQRGLAYYIDSRYRSDGDHAWMTLAIGVDPGKIDALKDLLKIELARLLDEPPTPVEVEEAKAHFIGRAASAAQSNEELTAMLARQWLWYGRTLDSKAVAQRLGAVTHQDVLNTVPRFVDGTIIVVRR